MTSHKWRKDRDGAESCERVGCTVRQLGTAWQEKKGRRWNPSHMPIPPCTGKEAGDVKAPTPPDASVSFREEFEERAQRIASQTAPSTLEVVLAAIDNLHVHSTAIGANAHRDFAYAAIATLEESIRKDEREKCAGISDHEASESEKMWRSVEDERKAYGWQCRSSGASFISKRIRSRQ